MHPMMANGERATLTIQGGPNNGTTIPLPERPLTVGRRTDNDVVVDESSVSRRHAMVFKSPSGVVVRDLDTTNGTFVNGTRIPRFPT